MHRRVTRKAGHYPASGSFLGSFLTMAIPFTIAHGVFLAVILGLIWKNAIGANAVSNTVLAYSIVATGALTPIGAPVAAAGPLTSGNIQVSQ